MFDYFSFNTEEAICQNKVLDEKLQCIATLECWVCVCRVTLQTLLFGRWGLVWARLTIKVIMDCHVSEFRRKLCIGRQPISGLPRYNPIHYWSKFCKGVKQGIQLACIRCPNAQEIS